MASYELDEPATGSTFDESAYLLANPDVARAVQAGQLASGRQHFDLYGRSESPPRMMRMAARIHESKRRKQKRILPLLRPDAAAVIHDDHVNCLPSEMRARWNITDAGKRPVSYDHVVNYEIVAYDTTDVVGVGEELPFADESFDAVISNAVLEHVKDPFRCAREIARVLKPGGELFCAVPLLQPLHGYPHHYYNMTAQGLRNLFADHLDVERIEVTRQLLPIWSLTWICSSWAAGLSGSAKDECLSMRIADFIVRPEPHLDRTYVTQLPPAVNSELASGHALFARKPGSIAAGGGTQS